MRRRGFTLVEVVFALLITGVLLGTLYQIFYASSQQGARLDAKNEALRSAMMASEILSREVDRLVTLPVSKDEQGKFQARYGDHQRPVYIGSDGKGVTFYVPTEEGAANLDGAEAEPLLVSLVASTTPGLYLLQRAQGQGAVEQAVAEGAGGTEEASEDADADEAAAAEPAAMAEGRRVYKGVHLRSLKLRLLQPDGEYEANKSPDDNYYLEAVVVGTDRKGLEQNAMTVLKPLVFPSRRLADPAVPAVKYQPTAPLSPPSVVVNPTPEEIKAADELVRLADEWGKGTITPEALVDRARTALDPIANTVPSGAIASNAPQVPRIPPGATVLSPPGPGPVVIGTPGAPGPVLVIPPPGGPAPVPISQAGGRGGTIEFMGWGAVLDANGNPIYRTGFSGRGDLGPGGQGWDAAMGAFNQGMGGIQGTLTTIANDYLRSPAGRGATLPAGS